jgi:UDP-N-acetylmuramoylalanine--D-glutamate ligase
LWSNVLEKYKGKRVLIIGAARQGLALARYLVKQGSFVTLTDNQNEIQMASEIESLGNLPVTWALGGHPLDLLNETDFVSVSGGVPLTIPILVEAKNLGIPLINDSQVFMEACPCKVVGITGSAGKTTTTALVGSIGTTHFQIKNLPGKIWVGGNIGNPLVEYVDELGEDDVVILELSSFQLELMSISPNIASILNITPNHLDRHGSMQSYIEAKSRILTFQNNSDISVLNRDDQGSWDLLDQVKSHLLTFGKSIPPRNINGTFVKRDHIYLQIEGEQIKLLPLEWIHMRGEHNLYNVLAACAISVGASFVLPAIQEAVDAFAGVPHRLEFVNRINGVNWYNDSKATSPDMSMAAIRSFDDPLILLAGGRDKKLPWEDFAALVRQRVNHLVCFGECAELIMNVVGQVEPSQKPLSITRCDGLEQAVSVAASIAQPGDCVLLSPGGTSFDEFKDFEERGEYYRKWVNELS